ncbi:MAG: hypothetical protein M1840_006318 [Geoglossum simile]|nr:MAG: hypothetical protein M1840_006318 [Geoglossum simile]
MIENEPLDGRAAFTLLQGILSAILVLFNNDISHGAIESNNILVANLSPKNPRFWLTGFSSARLMPENKLKESHSADVGMALRTVAEARGDPNYFEDPAANDIFAGFLQASQSKTLSAREILTEFNTLTNGVVGSLFEKIYLTKVFSIDQYQFCDKVYYWKNDIASIARTSLAHNTERSQEAQERVLRAKPSKILSEKGLLYSEEVKKLFDRLEVGIDVWFGFPTGPKRKRKGEARHMCEWRVGIQITYHVPSGMWNLSQLIDAVRPTPLDIGNPVDFVEVGGDTKYEGLYVDSRTFKHACSLLGISPPDSLKSNPELVDHRVNPFRTVSSGNGELVLAEEKLLGTPIFNRSSRTLYYSGKKYSEASALQLCTDYSLEGLRLGILQSGDPPQTIVDLCQGQPTREFPGSQLQSLTESESEDMKFFFGRQYVAPVQRQGGFEKPIREWVSEQTRRRRRQPSCSAISSYVCNPKMSMSVTLIRETVQPQTLLQRPIVTCSSV